ncbi:phosphatidylinositol-specific phospholipase C/glycerophosphodiester phosphodiesterase family protein [uncultured Paenibacillus sp.]|uniref:phosphatidylinositol-specific phospholipase C/glycerophosphodiester phosphodiesterase family protein n=1 Tax=uncultured Paenibacillus sp. TaxID=227322 RepID=UPI0015A8B4A7|nr:phosphatidylinositol-specific phospholipase C/glycerophosphodiester phosphodiesterase family protein [uncultured Paenibacillus sp.]
MKNKLLYNLLLLIGIALLALSWLPESPKAEDQGFKAHRMVAHAMGGIEGLTYTNSYDAFLANYEKGFRVFEVDLLLSSEGRLVARHEWGESFTRQLGQQDKLAPDRQGAVLTHAEFKAAKIQGIYEPLDWIDVLELMEQYPDVYIVTDTKQSTPDEIRRIFTQIVDEAKMKDPALLERVVPQIYNRSMWEPVERIYPFDSVIFTLYQTHETDEEVVAFAKDKELAAITMSDVRANAGLIRELNRIGVPSYIHTINDSETMAKLKKMGAYGFYTDFLTETDLAKNTGMLSWLKGYVFAR